MGGITQLLNSPYTFWALLALPSIGMMSGLLDGQGLASPALASNR